MRAVSPTKISFRTLMRDGRLWKLFLFGTEILGAYYFPDWDNMRQFSFRAPSVNGPLVIEWRGKRVN